MSNQPATSSVDVGTVIAETYVLTRILGRGGMGTVWEASHRRLPGKRVAIKVLHATIAEDADALARFRREAEIACRLGHPNIVEVHDFNKLEDGSPYLILELLEGCSLDQRLKDRKRLELEECEHILRQVGSALQSAHQAGVIHRDLKPQNIFLVPSPTGVGPDIAKLLDFGISKIHGSLTVKTQDSTLLGTPQYMAPEQAVGKHDCVDARTDLFALAAMLYELLSGRAAFAGQSIPEVVYKVVHTEPEPLGNLVPNLPEEKLAAISKGLSKSQDDRFATIGAFVEAFTGTSLPQSRAQRESVAAALGGAETLDSSKINIGPASTFESQSTQMPVAVPPPDLASAATVDSQKMEIESAATVDSSKLDRIEASVRILGEDSVQVQSVNVASVPPQLGDEVAPTRSRARGYVITMVVMCGAAVAAFMAIPETKSDEPQAVAVHAAADDDEVDPPDEVAAVVEKTTDHGFQQAVAPDAGPASVVTPTLDAAVVPIPRKKQGQRDKVRPPESGAGPTASPKGPQQELLARARKALKEGRATEAVALARKAHRLGKSSQSLVIQGKAFCLQKHLSNANAIRRSPLLSRRQKKELARFCKEVRFTLHQ